TRVNQAHIQGKSLPFVKVIFGTSELWKSLTTLTGSFERKAGIDYLLNEWSISIGVATEIKLNPDPHL
ncbi:hypothetical protein, partial [Klebsiella quasipneumoniae]|uniref:hypothetical protein n=3 Tax=Klebsiella TaxID=570 RepID=UPI0021DAA7CD